MRYQKGSIGLHERKDTYILRFVVESRYITHSQLLEFAKANFIESDRRIFNWRIRRLVRSGLVHKQVMPFLNGEALYSIRNPGIQALERLGVYYMGAHLEREKDVSEFQVPHALELNEIRMALTRTGLLSGWVPELSIRVLNLSPATAYAKVYDGIATVCLDEALVVFAVEYERTLKSQAKYAKIREAIESEKRISVFLYLVPTFELTLSLMNDFWDCKRLVFFGMVDEFKKNALLAPVTPARYDRMSFQSALLKAAESAKDRT